MNKLLNLIKEKCPDGVDYVEIKSIAEVGTGSFDRKDAVEDGGYPFYVRSKEIFKINRYEYDETAIVIPGEGGIGEIFHFVQGKYALHQRAYRIHLLDDRIDAKFLYYYMFANFKAFIIKKAVSATVTSIRKPMIEEFEIPVPPIEVQREIVRILDKFTELEAELQAELDARKKQYESYLAQFISNNLEYEIRTLGEIGVVRMCKRVLKDQTDVNGEIPFFKIGTFGGVPDAYISRELFEEYKEKYNYPKKGHVLISASGTIGRTVVFDGEPAYFQDSNIVWLEHDSTQVIDEYLEYVYKTNPWKISAGGTIARLYNDNIVNALIPVPSIADQKKIVKILGKYKEICEDTQTGLPAEIAARHKQYEYYRDKLLTFKRKEV